MAITKLVSATTPNPITIGGGGDWDKAMAQLTACKQILNGQNVILSDWNGILLPSIKKGAYIQHLGAVYVVDTVDYALPAIAVDGDYFLILTTSGVTLTASWVTDVSNFAWDATHNGMYDATDPNIQRTMFGVRVAGTATVFKKFRILAYSNIIVFGDGTIDSLSGYINILTPASIGGDLSVAGGLVVNSPAILAGGLTIMKYLRYGTTYIGIPTIDDLPVLAAGTTNLIGTVQGIVILTYANTTSVSKTLSGTVKSPFTFRTVLSAVAMIVEENGQPDSDYVTSNVTVALKINGILVDSVYATLTRYGNSYAYTDNTYYNTVVKTVETPVHIGDSITIVISATFSGTAVYNPGGNGGVFCGKAGGSYTGINCDRALNTIAGETLSLV